MEGCGIRDELNGHTVPSVETLEKMARALELPMYRLFQMALDGADGKPITDQGKDMAVWKKQADGAWKMAADTFNSDLALKQAKTPETKHQTIKHHPRKRHKTS